jgi:hypothetical protein
MLSICSAATSGSRKNPYHPWAFARRAAVDGGRVAAHHHRQRALERARMGADSREADERAVERRPLVFPERAHRAEVLGGPSPASLHRDPDCLHLGLEVADAHPEGEPSARDDVEAGELLGENHRVALRQDHDARGEADPLGIRAPPRAIRSAPGPPGWR